MARAHHKRLYILAPSLSLLLVFSFSFLYVDNTLENHFYRYRPFFYVSQHSYRTYPGRWPQILGTLGWNTNLAPALPAKVAVVPSSAGRLYREWWWSLPWFSQGLAFGRLGRVGTDGRLTGLFLLFFHCALELVLSREEEISTSACWKYIDNTYAEDMYRRHPGKIHSRHTF